jgi:hypothetical protein
LSDSHKFNPERFRLIVTVEEPLPRELKKVEPERPRKTRKHLPQLNEVYARVPLRWLSSNKILNGKARLFLWLIHRSYEGREPVEVTNKAVAEIGIKPRRKAEYLHELENLGCIRINQEGREASVVTVLRDLWEG